MEKSSDADSRGPGSGCQTAIVLPPPLLQVLRPLAEPEGIGPDLARIVGDFGPGSDAPIVLDYRFDAVQPQVLRLRWSRSEGNRWIVAAPVLARSWRRSG